MLVKQRRTKKEQAAATRAQLVAMARRLFAQRGYSDVSVDEIARAAKVTKGALYHHFSDKQRLFREVAEQIARETYVRLAEAASIPGDALERMRAACDAYLDACVETDDGQIVVLDSPGVLGWEGWRELDRRYGLGFFVERLRAVMPDDAGIEPAAQMLLGSLNVAARVIAEASDSHTARLQVGATIDRLLAGIVGSR